jgi:hypothetical protein
LVRFSWLQVVEGVALGILLALVDLMLLTNAPETTVLGGYVVIVFLVSLALTSSPMSGLTLGLSTIVGEIPTEFFYLRSAFGGLDLAVLPYAVGMILFVARIPLFLVAGAFGGYVGGEYFAEPKVRAVRTRRKVVRRKREAGETPAKTSSL